MARWQDIEEDKYTHNFSPIVKSAEKLGNWVAQEREGLDTSKPSTGVEARNAVLLVDVKCVVLIRAAPRTAAILGLIALLVTLLGLSSLLFP